MARRVCIRSLTALSATILAVLLFALGTTAQVRDFPDVRLPAPARGSAALGALAAHLPQIAAEYGKSTDELSRIFLQDHTLWTDTKSITVTGPDLYVSVLSAPTSAVAGSTITVKDTTKNQGAGPAAPSTTSYYLSIDSIYGMNDTPMGGRGVVTLLSGASTTVSVPVTIPVTTAGTYYIIARADSGDAVGETIETNNTRACKITVK